MEERRNEATTLYICVKQLGNMAKSLQYAADKWARKTANAGGKWKDAVSRADYCGPFQQFVGHPTPEACASYSAGVNAISASDFQAAITGKESKYIEGLRNVR